MAARRTFDQDMTQPAMLFEESGQGDHNYGGFLEPSSSKAKKRRVSEQDDPEMPTQRYIPPSTMEILLRESVKRGR